MSLRDLRPVLLIAFLGVAWALAESVEGLDVGLLSLAPALLLLVPLMFGRYVGERTLRRWASARRPPRRRLAGAVVPASPQPRSAVPHGGLLLACRIAGRAPPIAQGAAA